MSYLARIETYMSRKIYEKKDVELSRRRIVRKRSGEKGSSFRMPFGKYKGRSIKFLPDTYLSWGYENFKEGRVKKLFLRELARRGGTKLPKREVKKKFIPKTILRKAKTDNECSRCEEKYSGKICPICDLFNC